MGGLRSTAEVREPGRSRPAAAPVINPNQGGHMTKTTLTDVKTTAEKRLAEIAVELDRLDQHRGGASLAVMLGDDGADAKLQALGDQLRSLRQERDDLIAAIEEAGRRQQEEAQKKAAAAKQRDVKLDEQLTAERASTYDELAVVLKKLATLSVKAVQLDARIDAVRQRCDPARREHPNRQSISRIQDCLATVMATEGFDRAWPFPPPANRVENPNDYR